MSTKSSIAPGSLWGEEGMYDSALMSIMTNCGKIQPFFEAIFSFLSRRTDFYIIMEHDHAEMGFPPGVALNMVIQAFKKYEILTRKREAELMREAETRRIDLMTDDLSEHPKIDVPSSAVEHLSKLAKLKVEQNESKPVSEEPEIKTKPPVNPPISAPPPSSVNKPIPSSNKVNGLPHPSSDSKPLDIPPTNTAAPPTKPSSAPPTAKPSSAPPTAKPSSAPPTAKPSSTPPTAKPSTGPPTTKPLVITPTSKQSEAPPTSATPTTTNSTKPATSVTVDLKGDSLPTAAIGGNSGIVLGEGPGVKLQYISKDQLSSDAYNGSKTDDYVWSQTMTDLDMKIPVPLGTTGKALNVTIKSDSLKIELLKPQRKVIIDGRLLNRIKVEESLWSLDKTASAVHVNLEKNKELMWKSVFEGEKGIDLTKVDTTRDISEFDEEAQAAIQKVTYDHHMKMLGKPTSNEQKAHDILRKAWDAPGSPFKGTPFDPSRVNIAGVW